MRRTIVVRQCPALAALLLVIAWVAPSAAQTPPTGQPAPTQQQEAQQPQQAPPPTAAAAPQPGQSGVSPELSETVARLATSIETAEKTIQRLAEIEEGLGGLRVDVEAILSDSAQAAEALRPELAAVKSQIEKLGPAPGKNDPPEAPALAAERARLKAQAAELDGAIKTTELTWVRARQLIEKITVLRHSLFTKNLLERRPSPLLPELWREVASKSPAVGHRISYLATDWLYWARLKSDRVWLLLVATVAVFVVLRLVLNRYTDRRGLRREPPPPTFFERAKSVAWVAPLRALPTIAASLTLYAGLDSLGLLFTPWNTAVAATLKAVALYAAVSALVFAILAPSEPQWRLVSLADRPARLVAWLLCAITALYGLDTALTEMSRVFYVPLALTVVQSFVTSTAFAGLLIGLLLIPFTPKPPETSAVAASTDGASQPPSSRYARRTPVWLKLPLWAIALAILGLMLLGYVALARFVAQQLVMTGIVLAVTWLLYLAIRAVTQDVQQQHDPVGEMLQTRFGLDEPRRNQLARLTEIALTFALVICAIPFLMLQWGFSGADIRDSFKALFFGLEIGQFRISLARILLGIVLFIAFLFSTRLFQRWLRERMLKQPRLDPGIANSVDTVVGYAGTALGALLAISYAGFDITSLAIVAGALSVGIGFGLQSIVNNFVSGLILLIERPIKVGDWIVVGDQQGNVRRISVRSTEIETFDRASLIIPNSELITGRVLNWTHRNLMGAVNVKVGVGYDSDPEQVIAILKKCAESHPEVLKVPAPGAALEKFGDSALMFNLRISLSDVNKASNVQSELRIAILKACREAGIEIPFNQLDVNLRGLAGTGRHLSQRVQDRTETTADQSAASASNGKRATRE